MTCLLCRRNFLLAHTLRVSSNKTRIMTGVSVPFLRLSSTLRVSSNKTRIMTHLDSSLFRNYKMSLRVSSNKTRIMTSNLLRHSCFVILLWEYLPIKQGLWPSEFVNNRQNTSLWEYLPIKQGLWPFSESIAICLNSSLRVSSNKTRIMTLHAVYCCEHWEILWEYLPIKQGLWPINANNFTPIVRTSESIFQ